jgi:hypothetical protein
LANALNGNEAELREQCLDLDGPLPSLATVNRIEDRFAQSGRAVCCLADHVLFSVGSRVCAPEFVRAKELLKEYVPFLHSSPDLTLPPTRST